MGTILKFAEATRDLEDSFILNPLYKNNNFMDVEEAIARSYVYGGILAMIFTVAIIQSI